jgi:hypothetical protein
LFVLFSYCFSACFSLGPDAIKATTEKTYTNIATKIYFFSVPQKKYLYKDIQFALFPHNVTFYHSHNILFGALSPTQKGLKGGQKPPKTLTQIVNNNGSKTAISEVKKNEQKQAIETVKKGAKSHHKIGGKYTLGQPHFSPQRCHIFLRKILRRGPQ